MAAFAETLGDHLKICPNCDVNFTENLIESLYGFCEVCEKSTCLRCGHSYHGTSCVDLGGMMNNLSLDHIPDDQIGVFMEAMYPQTPPPEEVQSPKSQKLPIKVTTIQKIRKLFKKKNIFGFEIEIEKEVEVFSCTICLEDDVKLEDGIHYGCNHLFCKSCIKKHLETHINSKNIELYDCPFVGCEQKADYNLIKKIIDPRVFDAFDNLLLDRVVENDPEIVKCPKCDRRTYPEPAYAFCVDCNYQFCAGCYQDFHGVIRCGLTEEDRNSFIRRTAAALTAEEEERIRREVNEKKQREDNASEGLIRVVCKKCPKCRANIEKNFGCNHMTCSKCKADFCWLCLEIISSRDPNSHFQKECKLFQYDSDGQG